MHALPAESLTQTSLMVCTVHHQSHRVQLVASIHCRAEELSVDTTVVKLAAVAKETACLAARHKSPQRSCPGTLRVVVNNGGAVGLVVAGCQVSLSAGKAHSIAETLAQGACSSMFKS